MLSEAEQTRAVVILNPPKADEESHPCIVRSFAEFILSASEGLRMTFLNFSDVSRYEMAHF
jgi:methyl coenzyme M reductase gamma subunit